MDNWQMVWDWARGVWGDNSDYSFHRFFGRVASDIAQREGWEELGSSDVWHASFSCVERAMQAGTVTNRAELRRWVCDCQGVWGYA